MIYDVTPLGRKIKEGSGTDEEKLKVLEFDGTYIQYCTNPTYEMQRIAVVQNGYAIKFIHNPSMELLEISIKQSPSHAALIKNPTREQIDLILSISPKAIEFLTSGVTKEDWLQCIKKDISLIKYIPRKFLNDEICLEVGLSDYTRIRHIPPNMITEDVALKFVQKYGLALQFLPDTISDLVKITAISNSPEAAKFVKSLDDIDGLFLCINNNEKVIDYLSAPLLKIIAKKYREAYLRNFYELG